MRYFITGFVATLGILTIVDRAMEKERLCGM